MINANVNSNSQGHTMLHPHPLFPRPPIPHHHLSSLCIRILRSPHTRDFVYFPFHRCVRSTLSVSRNSGNAKNRSSVSSRRDLETRRLVLCFMYPLSRLAARNVNFITARVTVRLCSIGTSPRLAPKQLIVSQRLLR